MFLFLFEFDAAGSDGFDNFHPPSTPASSYSQQQQQQQQQAQQQQQSQHLFNHGVHHQRGGIPPPLHLHALAHGHPMSLTPTASSTAGSSLPNSPLHGQYTPATPGPSSGLTALLSTGLSGLLNSNGSVPTSVIQAPLTASPASSSGSPSGGEDSYFNELAMYNAGSGSYSGLSALGSPQRRKKMRKSRSPGPDGCGSGTNGGGTGKRKNREGNLSRVCQRGICRVIFTLVDTFQRVSPTRHILIHINYKLIDLTVYTIIYKFFF